MKLRVSLISVLLILTIVLSGCSQEKKTKTTVDELEQTFLTSFFTTNQDGRWDTYQDADFSDEKSANEAVEQYYSAFRAMCTEEGVDSMAANRLPYVFDEMAEQYNCSIKPENITITQDEDTVEFTLDLIVTRDGENLGEVEQSGQLQLIQSDGKYLVDSVWIANLNDLTEFLAGM